jgi:hypothetical protein
MRRISLAMTIFIGVLLLAGCNLGGGTADQSEQSAQQTLIAQAVQQTQAAMAGDVTLVAPPTGEPAAQAPRVSVSTATFCRTGPGEPFEIVGTLNVGQSAEVVGRSEYGDTWIIRLPDNPAITCWLWGHYASVTGDTSGLTVYPNPPTPTPALAFTFSLQNSWYCPPGFGGLEFQVTNTGGVTWESFRLDINDLDAGEAVSYLSNVFKDIDAACFDINTQQSLSPGEVGVAANLGAYFTYDPTGHSITATLQLCTQDMMGGECLQQTITVNP